MSHTQLILQKMRTDLRYPNKLRNEYHKKYRATVDKENEIIEAVKKITINDKDDERILKTIQIKTFNGNHLLNSDTQINPSLYHGMSDIRSVKRLIENTKKREWKDGTCLIVGDSAVLGVQEKRMGDKIKVRGFTGATVNDFYFFLAPLLQKKTSYLIFMAGTNDDIDDDANLITGNFSRLKLSNR